MVVYGAPLSSYLPIGVFGLQPLSLDNVDADQTLLNAIGRKFSEMSGGSRGRGVIWQGIDLKHTLVSKGERGQRRDAIRSENE